MKKGTISNALRQMGLLFLVDRLRFYFQQFKNQSENKAFREAHPNVVLPPDYLIYESFQLNYRKYFTESKDTARWLADHFRKYMVLKNKKILDWGCGPARIIRHLPAEIGNGCTYYGTDYNAESIKWCSANLHDIQFNLNTLEAKLAYPNDFFDVIYGISIFTHLSEQLHVDWFNELHRILKPGGIMFLTTQGNNFEIKLTGKELNEYRKGNLVVRGKVKEGHRTYSAFHPRTFMNKLFERVEILEHIETFPITGGNWLPQDIWMIRKK
jgi:SAM-dependent methyltransferase